MCSPTLRFGAGKLFAKAQQCWQMDTLGTEPRAFRMRSGCDTTTPCAPCSSCPALMYTIRSARRHGAVSHVRSTGWHAEPWLRTKPYARCRAPACSTAAPGDGHGLGGSEPRVSQGTRTIAAGPWHSGARGLRQPTWRRPVMRHAVSVARACSAPVLARQGWCVLLALKSLCCAGCSMLASQRSRHDAPIFRL